MPRPDGMFVKNEWFHDEEEEQDFLTIFIDGMRYPEPDIRPDERTTQNWIAFTPEEVEYLVFALGAMLNEYKTQ